MNTLERIGSKMAFKMAQQMKALTAKLEDLSLVQGPHTEERELMPALPHGFHKITVACMSLPSNHKIINNYQLKKKPRVSYKHR